MNRDEAITKLADALKDRAKSGAKAMQASLGDKGTVEFNEDFDYRKEAADMIDTQIYTAALNSIFDWNGSYNRATAHAVGAPPQPAPPVPMPRG